MGLLHVARRGRVHVITGPMGGGKTTELIRLIQRAEIGRRSLQVFKHALDNRYAGVHALSSHGGFSYPGVIPVRRASDIREQVLPDTDLVVIDEVQFFDADLVPLVSELADHGHQVVCGGIDTDFRATPFGIMGALLAVADEVQKLKAVCVVCGADATRTQRLTDDGRPASVARETVEVGDIGRYEARCRYCHEVPGA